VFKDLNIKAVYNSEEDNILEDFYIPVLQQSVAYDRAVGYFDAKMLTNAGEGLSAFIENSGYMRLIVGNTLNEDEYVAIEKGYSAREILDRAEAEFQQIIETSQSDLFHYQLNSLAWLIEHNKLDIKMAFRRHGIHHQKIGIFRDKAGDFIVFQGSANETVNALRPFNYETINVFKGWQPEFKAHYEPHIQSFKKLWANQTTNTLVLDFSDITRKVLSQNINRLFKPSLADEVTLWQENLDNGMIAIKNISDMPRIPQKIGEHDFSLRPHQRRALESWKQNNFKGLFELATGAGKTMTAIYAIVKMYESRKRLFAVISVPYQSLADQWGEELKRFNISPLICYGGENKWKTFLDRKILDFKNGLINFCAVVVVDATLASKNRCFLKLINELVPEYSRYLMFIGDECHHHGADAIAKALPHGADLRMGLSATPERGEDDIGNQHLQNYYGGSIARYDLEDALRDKVLTPYEYHIVPVSLTEEEAEEYIILSKRISQAYAVSKTSGDSVAEDSLNILLSKRARLISGAENKEEVLENLLKEIGSPIKHSLFYCAEGKQGGDEGEGQKRIQAISRLLNAYGWKTSQFTANENKYERERILEDFKEGRIDSLAAMKCLDEGIDIPACDTAFILASSCAPRQFIQRRGRILRKSQGKEKAVIYDFLVTLPEDINNERDISRKLMKTELQRIWEFSHLARNRSENYHFLKPYLEKYDLYHYMV